MTSTYQITVASSDTTHHTNQSSIVNSIKNNTSKAVHKVLLSFRTGIATILVLCFLLIMFTSLICFSLIFICLTTVLSPLALFVCIFTALLLSPVWAIIQLLVTAIRAVTGL